MKKKLGLAAMLAAAATMSTSVVYAADMDAMVTKAPMMAPAAVAPTACGSITDFFLTSCPLSWYGVTFYGIIDVGGGYQTHATPFDKNFPTGSSYFIQPQNRGAAWTLGPNGLSQSQVGFKVKEAIGGDWSFISDASLAFDPYSGLLSNAPQSLQNGIGVPINQQLLPVDSSRWGWLASQIYAGVTNPTYGTLTFGRMNSLQNDMIIAYDPMGASYAFSPIGFSGKVCGAGDTEECRWTTAIRYRENIGPFRFAIEGQPLQYGAYNPNNGAIQGQIGGDIKGYFPGVLSLDVSATWEKDAVNIGPAFVGQASTASGMPIAPFVGGAASYLKATVSNNTGVMAVGKWSINLVQPAPAPLVIKGGPVPPPASGGLLTLYAGYEWMQFANPSDPQASFYDDGFRFTDPAGGLLHGAAPSANGTAINNNAFNALCGTGTGCSNEIFQTIWTGAKYGITKDLDIIGAYYHYWQNQYVNGVGICANSGAHGQCAGTEDMISAVIDYRFLPKWDVYLGTMFSQVNGGLANGYLSRNNLSTDAGIRFRF
jgi:predicted porin